MDELGEVLVDKSQISQGAEYIQDINTNVSHALMDLDKRHSRPKKLTTKME